MLSAWTATAAPTPELMQALEQFRTEGPKGWAFTQSTSSPDRSRVESFDPLQPYHLKWTLIAENNRPPEPSELEKYRQQQMQRNGAGSAPNVKEQMDYDTAELIAEDEAFSTWVFDLKASETDDSSAEHMAVRLRFHKPSQTITQVQLPEYRSASARPRILFQIPGFRSRREVFGLPLRRETMIGAQP